MATVDSGTSDEGERVRPPRPSRKTADRRWLTREAAERARDELEARRNKAGKNLIDFAEDHENLWLVAGDAKGATWGALAKRLMRSWATDSRKWRTANTLAAHLLGAKIEDITVAELPPDDLAIADEPGPRDGTMRVSYPRRITDHRAVILGQLPGPDLYPVVLVRPDDGSGFWYPQCGKNNPLQAGQAFTCFAHFGNPNGIDPRPPVSYRVRVCALSSKWGDNSNRLDDDQLKERLRLLAPVGKPVEFDVERGSPVNTISIANGGKQHVWTDTHHKVQCFAPIEINWKGQKDAHIEIRAGACDSELVSQFVRPPVLLTLPGQRKAKGRRNIVLAGPGLYRIRLFPLKYSFMDPPYEWWLDLVDGPSVIAPRVASRRVPRKSNLSSGGARGKKGAARAPGKGVRTKGLARSSGRGRAAGAR